MERKETRLTKTKNIRSLSLDQIQDTLKEWGEAKFRAKQIYEWLWKKGAGNFDEMSNLSKALREKLKEEFSIDKVQIEDRQRSSDGTIKYAFRLSNGNQVEGVLIPTPKRVTACVSSQAGCSLACKFCATGFLDLKHNLHHYEIFDQVQMLREEAEKEAWQKRSQECHEKLRSAIIHNQLEELKSLKAELASLRKGLETTRSELAAAQKAKESTEELLEEFESEREAHEFDMSRREGLLEKERTRLQEMQAKLTSMEAERQNDFNKEYQRSVDEFNTKVEAMEKQRQAVQNRLESIQKQQDERHETLAKLQQSLEEREKTIHAKEERVKVIENSIQHSTFPLASGKLHAKKQKGAEKNDGAEKDDGAENNNNDEEDEDEKAT